MAKIGPIFIGGTGRSGTTLLQKVLGHHHDIFCLPFESRFIIDTNGLIDLVFRLTDGWTPVNADIALKSFHRLMLKDLNVRCSYPYRGFRFGWYFSEPFYSNLVKTFLNDLLTLSFPGRTALRRGYGSQIIYHVSPLSRKELLERCARFINSLFGHKMQEEQKRIWAEKTPHNILHIGFLNSLFPNARFICIHRDPRDVVASLLQKPWAPNRVEGAVQWLLDVYNRYDEVRSSYPDIQVYEVYLESLVENQDRELEKLVEFIGLLSDFDFSGVDFSRAHIGRWR
ncbi:MAG: sulfotransferase, partial [Chloroflexi bacterium]|nr:sulfotransferase [Chloroflexota bacterium]